MKLQNHPLVSILTSYQTDSTDQLCRRIRRTIIGLLDEIHADDTLTEQSVRVANLTLSGASRLCTFTTPVEEQKQILTDALDILVSAAPQFSWRRAKIIRDDMGSIVTERQPILAENISPSGHGGECTCESMPLVSCGAVLHSWI